MEVVGRVAHRLLAYLAAVGDQGMSPSVDELDAYAEEQEPKLAPDWYVDSSLEEAPYQWTWSWAYYLRHRGWATITEHPDEDLVRISRLGRALLAHLDQQSSVDHVASVELLAEGSVSYGRVIGRIAQHEQPLLVDAYADVASVPDLVLHTSVSRLLLSEKPGKRGKTRVAEVIGAVGRFALEGRPLEIRASNDLHDRFVVPGHGPIEAIGTSLNGTDRHISTYVTIQGPEAQALREYLEGVWRSGSVLFPHPTRSALATGEEETEDDEP